MSLTEKTNAPDFVIAAIAHGHIFNRGDLQEALDRVANAENWKLPIDATVELASIRDFVATLEATRYFAGCEATIKVTGFNLETGCAIVRVTAPGYYAAVGA